MRVSLLFEIRALLHYLFHLYLLHPHPPSSHLPPPPCPEPHQARKPGIPSPKYKLTTPGLRPHPIVANNSRTCLRRTVLPAGGGPHSTTPLLLLPGDTVSMSIYALHRRTDLFRPDADRFRPERWATLLPIWDFVPFSGGPRYCPAQQLARSEIGYVLVRLARGFQGVERRDLVREFVEEVRLTFESFHGVKVGLIPA